MSCIDMYFILSLSFSKCKCIMVMEAENDYLSKIFSASKVTLLSRMSCYSRTVVNSFYNIISCIIDTCLIIRFIPIRLYNGDFTVNTRK